MAASVSIALFPCNGDVEGDIILGECSNGPETFHAKMNARQPRHSNNEIKIYLIASVHLLPFYSSISYFYKTPTV